MNVFGRGFGKVEVVAAAERKQLRLKGGISCVIDWESACPAAFQWFDAVATRISEILGDAFSKQERLHSTVLSLMLDEVDLLEITPDSERARVRSRVWRDPDFGCWKRILPNMASVEGFKLGLTFSVDCAVLARAGTIQLVLRNEDFLPAIRGVLVSHGAQVKPKTIDGDFIYTGTVVLGQVVDADRANEKVQEVRDYLGGLSELEGICAASLAVIRYRDFALNDCDEIDSLRLV